MREYAFHFNLACSPMGYCIFYRNSWFSFLHRFHETNGKPKEWVEKYLQFGPCEGIACGANVDKIKIQLNFRCLNDCWLRSFELAAQLAVELCVFNSIFFILNGHFSLFSIFFLRFFFLSFVYVVLCVRSLDLLILFVYISHKRVDCYTRPSALTCTCNIKEPQNSIDSKWNIDR